MKQYIEVYSPILKENIRLETNDLNGPKHAALEACFYDKIQPDFGAVMKTEWIKAEKDHSVVQITIFSEILKRKITVNGESTTESLATEIAKNNPSTIAFNRAVDRAILKFLGIYGIYADSENVKQDNLVVTSENSDISEPHENKNSVQIIDEKEEYRNLLKTTCPLKIFEVNGKKGYPKYGWILKNHPEIINGWAQEYAGIDKSSVPQNTYEAIRSIYRILELHAKFTAGV